MAITTVISREFKQDTGKAKKAARRGPVFITDRGRPAHALMSIEQYQAITGSAASIIELLAMAGAEEIDFKAPRTGKLTRPAKLK